MKRKLTMVFKSRAFLMMILLFANNLLKAQVVLKQMEARMLISKYHVY
ncbi:hypothetical protein [Mucilaginibacter sp. SJ]|nr:hypothetical protein [Mucilaginibacter sp. SJ]WEA01139.1 hypothetical protein MusilaSJ_27165 [Mucilaginibacter sp. SJ]